jgi:hypothetical protein
MLNYPDFKCSKVTLPVPEVREAKNYADLVVFDASSGAYIVIPTGTLALYSNRCFICVEDCANWQPGNELYWKLTDFACTLSPSSGSTFTAQPPTLPSCLADNLSTQAFTSAQYTYAFSGMSSQKLRVING